MRPALRLRSLADRWPPRVDARSGGAARLDRCAQQLQQQRSGAARRRWRRARRHRGRRESDGGADAAADPSFNADPQDLDPTNGDPSLDIAGSWIYFDSGQPWVRAVFYGNWPPASTLYSWSCQVFLSTENAPVVTYTVQSLSGTQTDYAGRDRQGEDHVRGRSEGLSRPLRRRDPPVRSLRAPVHRAEDEDEHTRAGRQRLLHRQDQGAAHLWSVKRRNPHTSLRPWSKPRRGGQGRMWRSRHSSIGLPDG